MNLELTEEEAAALLRELDGIIAADRYFLSPRITTLKAIRSKIRPEPERAVTAAETLRAAPHRHETAARVTSDRDEHCLV